jgi:DNA-directed RNA polymerase beta subunit
MQCIQIDGAEPPLVFSGFENQVGKFSTGYKEIKGDWKIIKKINKNKYNYVLIVQNTEDKNQYDILYRTNDSWLTEHFGYKNKNEVMDKYSEDEIIPNGEIIHRNMNYDDEMNFQYGRNLNAVYLPYAGFTNEDAIVISESTAKNMSSYFVKKIEVNVNTNDLLCNIYGDKENYKTFPDIGERIKNGILLARRRINYENNIYNLKNLDKIKEDDDCIYYDGLITDINVYSNCDLDKMKNQEYNKQVLKYINEQKRYYQEIIDTLNEIRKYNKKYDFTDDLLFEFNKCLKFTDPNVILNSDGRNFDNFIITFTVFEKKPLTIGSKLTGRYGRLNNSYLN